MSPIAPRDVTRPSSRNWIEVDQLAALVERAALFVAHLPAEPRQAEQLVDVREIEQRHPAQAIGQLHRRQRLLPQLLAPIGLDAVGGQRPRRRFEDVLVADIAMREHVLEVVGQRPHAAFLDHRIAAEAID